MVTRLLLAVPLAVGLVFGASEATPAQEAGGGDPEDLELLEAGRRLYVEDCASCHGIAGRGIDGQAPAITDAGAAGAHFYISSGRMPMAAISQQSRRKPVTYDEQEVDALVLYVASLGDGGLPIPELDLDDADLAEGNVLYAANCAACHNSAGSGGALGMSIFAPPVYDATPLQVAEAIRIGPGAMPAFSEGVLDQQQMEDIVAYVEFLDDPTDRGGAPLGRVGPIPEGLVAWIIGVGLLLLATFWIGTREPREPREPHEPREPREPREPQEPGEPAA